MALFFVVWSLLSACQPAIDEQTTEIEPQYQHLLENARPAEPVADRQVDPFQNATQQQVLPLPAGAREVELSVNGVDVRVVRPSLNNPFVVAGAEFEIQSPGERSTGPRADDSPQLVSLDPGVVDVIRRVPQSVSLTVSDPNGVGDITGYHVDFEGYEGHFFIPTQIDSEIFGAARRERGRINLDFFMDEVFPPGSTHDTAWANRAQQPFRVNMRIWAVDRQLNRSQVVTQVLNVLPVGNGDLEVTLSMSLPTDLDLYVVEPNGNVIYYANMHSHTRGQLDLDANAACSGNSNVRYEHIFWPAGSVPEGTYQIRVDNWQNCVGGQDVTFEVIIQNCGDITVHEGIARGQGGRGDCRNPQNSRACQEIATVEVLPCDQPTVP